ncbi:hypothetical protein CVT24_012815 [Panaeolus cyanescens]|uniref:Uncharacterized protein n=1 Tax=Panaeolus cyanescens TaxID=181874 RepID=A0A409YJS0_9AGAR|nr:hypothetical protein CVT24_012815 [Panaeolus cyanescens]
MSGTLDNDSHSWMPVGVVDTSLQVLADPLNLLTSTTGVGFAYGGCVFLYALTAAGLGRFLRKQPWNLEAIVCFGYASTLLAVATMYCLVNTWMAEISYVENYIGYYENSGQRTENDVYGTLVAIAEIASFFANWMCGGLMVSAANGIEQHTFWLKIAPRFTKAQYYLMTSFAVMTTCLVVIRFLYVRLKLTTTEKKGHLYYLKSLWALVIDSSMLYTSWMITFLVLYMRNSPVQLIFLGTMPEIQVHEQSSENLPSANAATSPKVKLPRARTVFQAPSLCMFPYPVGSHAEMGLQTSSQMCDEGSASFLILLGATQKWGFKRALRCATKAALIVLDEASGLLLLISPSQVYCYEVNIKDLMISSKPTLHQMGPLTDLLPKFVFGIPGSDAIPQHGGVDVRRQANWYGQSHFPRLFDICVTRYNAFLTYNICLPNDNGNNGRVVLQSFHTLISENPGILSTKYAEEKPHHRWANRHRGSTRPEARFISMKS